MAFVYREERKLGPRNIPTGKLVGPGAYLGNDNLVASKPRASM